ncbi:hypothetical protein [Rubritalea marina]|uniref:hypothetical protein n=1 Tax=Rubritalea marina TaxID=361055 RepID=UPI00036BD5BB|nr:hypothetical protein [Rubritalea marina]
MSTSRSILLALIAALIGFAIWWFLPQNVILRRSAALIDCARMEDGTGRIERSFKAEDLIDLTCKNLLVSYPPIQSNFHIPRSQVEPVMVPQQQAKAALTFIMETADWIEISEPELEIKERDEHQASVDVAFTMHYQTRNKKPHSIDFSGTFTFKKIEKEWLVSGVHFE